MSVPDPVRSQLESLAGLARDAEWLEADGLGGFASGPVVGARTRRYQALLLTATTPPTGRVVQVNGVEVHVESDADSIPLSTNHYLPDVVHPDGWRRLVAFHREPWPTWTFHADGRVVQQEILVARDSCETVLRWSLPKGGRPLRLRVRLLMSGRDYHALQRQNPAFEFAPVIRGGNVTWRPYPGIPAVTALTNAVYAHEPEWFQNVSYAAEQNRGLDYVEDLASPGTFVWDLQPEGEAVLVLRSGDSANVRAQSYANLLIERERQRRAQSTPIDLAADSYLVDRAHGQTLLAGFPWFTDWGRDTFIAMRGLVTARERFSHGKAILNSWAGTVSEGMLPNRFLDGGETPEYNSVDSSLWFIIAGHEFMVRAKQAGYSLGAEFRQRLISAFDQILTAYENGTRYGIAADRDGLLRAGVPGVQLTWMDAKVGDTVITPRIGKPVEIQALWINALRIAGIHSMKWAELEQRARTSFQSRFSNPANGGLFDVVDEDHIQGKVDARLRPNQIFAVGGLPYPLIEGEAARSVVELVERELVTPLGLRTLSAADPSYRQHYEGSPWERDSAYHQGTVWPWLLGPFIEAKLRVSKDKRPATLAAASSFLAAFATHLEVAGLGHVSEIADAEPPHTPRGCPFQAWSLGEFIRARDLLQTPSKARAK